MKIESFQENLNFNDSKVITQVLLETSFSEENEDYKRMLVNIYKANKK